MRAVLAKRATVRVSIVWRGSLNVRPAVRSEAAQSSGQKSIRGSYRSNGHFSMLPMPHGRLSRHRLTGWPPDPGWGGKSGTLVEHRATMDHAESKSTSTTFEASVP